MSKQILDIKQTTPETFFVTSGTDERVGYTVNIKEGTCDCPVNFHKGEYCKHMNTVDEYLMIQDEIPVDECEKCEPEDYNTNCQFQQVMFDRGYILFVIKDKHIWKKREAWEKMAEEKQGVIELGEVDRHLMVHGYCSYFHLFPETDHPKVIKYLKDSFMMKSPECIVIENGEHMIPGITITTSGFLTVVVIDYLKKQGIKLRNLQVTDEGKLRAFFEDEK